MLVLLEVKDVAVPVVPLFCYWYTAEDPSFSREPVGERATNGELARSPEASG